MAPPNVYISHIVWSALCPTALWPPPSHLLSVGYHSYMAVESHSRVEEIGKRWKVGRGREFMGVILRG